jgi:UDP-glucose 4-epimerase
MSSKAHLTVLVTGASGRLGSALTPLLLKRGATVVGCDLKKPDRPPASARGRFIFKRCDITSARALENLFRKYRFDAVVHLAALLPKGNVNARELFSHNAAATFELVSASVKAGVKRFIFSSSMTVYGLPQYLPVDEAHPREPLDFYGATKLMGEEIVRHLCAEAGMGHIILRFPGMFSSERHEGALYNFVRRALQNEPIELTAEKPTPWDIISVDDAAAAIRDCVYLPKRSGGAFNVGYEEKVSLPILASAVKKMTHSSSEILNRTGTVHPPFCFDTRKIKKVLGVRLPKLETRLEAYVAVLRNRETKY